MDKKKAVIVGFGNSAVEIADRAASRQVLNKLRKFVTIEYAFISVCLSTDV